MKKILINVVLGLLLFAGALVGGLAATGRLNHEGTANIPVLGSFFPEPPKPPEGEAGAGEGEHGAPAGEHGAPADAHGDKAAAPADADHAGGPAKPEDAAHGAEGEQDPQGEEKPRKTKDGKSIVQPEKPPDSGGHGGGGGHGEAPADAHGGGGHGEEAKDGHGEKPAAKDGHGAKPKSGGAKSGAHDAERDFSLMEQNLANDRKAKYAPGGFSTFPGMPAGLTPEQLNDAYERVKVILADLEKRNTALELRERELQVLAEDGLRRQREIADERLRVETLGRQLDERIAKFQEQVKMVRNDEVAALKRNAQTLASFERSKAAELLAEQWRTDKGQDEVLKTFEFMDKDAVNEIINAMPNPMVQDLMKKRLRVAKEATPSAGPPK